MMLIKKSLLGTLFVFVMAGFSYCQAYIPHVKQARDLYVSGRFSEAAEILDVWLPKVEEERGIYDSVYQKLCEMAGDCFRNTRHYEQAISVYSELAKIHASGQGENRLQYTEDLSKMADCYYQLVNYKTAISLYEEVKCIKLELLGSGHPSYARTLAEMGTLFYVMENYQDALALFEEALEIDKNAEGARQSDYANDMGNLAMTYKMMGNYTAAMPLFMESCELYKQISGERSTDYASAVSKLSGLYISTGKYTEALPLYQKVKSIRAELLGTNNAEYARALNNLGYLYIRMGNYEAALPLYDSARIIRKEVLGTKSIDYATSLNNLASLQSRLGNYATALSLFEESSGIYKDRLGENNSDYATSLNNISLIYSNMGNYEAALPLLLKAIEIDSATIGTRNLDYASDLINLVNLYSALEKYDLALPLSKQASALYKDVSGEKHPDYALSLNSLARLYNSMGDFESALPLLIQATSIYKESVGPEHIDYAISLKNLAITYKELGDYKTARPLLEEVSVIFKEVLGEKHPEYAYSLTNLAEVLIKLQNFDAALPMLEEANSIVNLNIQDYFSFLSETEKGKYLSRVGYNYDIYLSFLLNYNPVSPGFCNRIYDNELLLKGLVLSSVTAFQQTILESGDSSLISRYEQMRMYKKQINFWQQKPVSQRITDMASLELKSQELEKELTKQSSTFNQLQAAFKIKWKDVRARLKVHEAAIEFVNFHYYRNDKKTDSILYCALVLRENDTAPQLRFLCEESLIKKLLPVPGASSREINSFYKDICIYNLVWQPISSLLRDINTVYFAPSGLLNRISLAAILCPDSTELMEKYKLVQLTSTRTLALKQDNLPISNAVIFGGISYDTDSLTLLAKTSKYPKKERSTLSLSRSADSENRSGFRYLPGTLKEAELIAGTLKKKGFSSTILSGADAVEESFSALSGKNSPSVIHLSTHGYYFPDPEDNKGSNTNNQPASGEPRFRNSKDPLFRSGLLMAGSNLAWKGISISADVEDGILTAKEVSTMNLSNTQLVVLSACQTGQGDVKGYEGVEGLQRGFKMAGARFILMSLWEVADKETTEFMDAFYDTWTNGIEIHDAFRATQIRMSNKYKHEPFKWAAFVLVE